MATVASEQLHLLSKSISKRATSMQSYIIQDFGLALNLSSRAGTWPNGSMNLSVQNTEADNAELMEINRQKAGLLIPAILYTVLLMVIGAVGNPLAIYIYGWKWQNSTTRIFLFCLAWLDLVNCLITMPTEIYVMVNFYYFPNPGFCRMSRFITYVINNGTSAVFLVIALDRYIRICHPHRRAISILGAKIFCVISLCIGVGVSWPALALYGSKKVQLPSSRNDKGYIFGVICAVRNEMDDTPYPLAFFIYLWCGFSACVLILSIMYILIGRVMLKRRRNKKKKKRNKPTNESVRSEENGEHDSVFDPTHEGVTSEAMSGVSQNEANSGDTKCIKVMHAATNSWRHSRMRPPRSTLMLFAITAVFLLTFLPFLIIMIIRQHRGPSFYPSLGAAEQVAVNIFSRSYLVNNCANPIVYGMFNSQFRDQVRKLFHMATRRRDSSLSRDESKLSRGLSC